MMDGLKHGDLPPTFPSKAGTKVEDGQFARHLCLETMAERYGEAFAIDAFEEAKVRGLTVYNLVAAPETRRFQAFGCTLRVDEGSRKVAEGPLTDYSHYLFKERAERPFTDAVKGANGLAGYAATLTYVRYDDVEWRREDYPAYMGSGGIRDPRVEVLLMFPRGLDAEEYAARAKPCLDSLYGLGLPVGVYMGVEGSDPIKQPLRGIDVDEEFPGTRSGGPDERRLRQDFDDALFEFAFDAQWDGDGNPDGKPFDPGSARAYPTVHWNPGHGPSTWG